MLHYIENGDVSPTVKALEIFFDGGGVTNDIRCSVHCPHTGYIFFYDIGQGTTNQAEYYGIISAMTYALRLAKEDSELSFSIKGDSQLVVYQIQGKYRCKHEPLKPLLKEALDLRSILIERCRHLEILWIPRNLNSADEFTNARRIEKHIRKKGMKKAIQEATPAFGSIR